MMCKARAGAVAAILCMGLMAWTTLAASAQTTQAPSAQTGKPPSGQTGKPPSAQTTKAPVAPKVVRQDFEAWALQCNEPEKPGPRPRDCLLFQRLADKQSNRTVVMWTVQPGEKSAFISVIQAPQPIYLPAGLRLLIDGKDSYTVPFLSCGAERCEARFPMQPEVVDALLKAKSLGMAYRSLDNRDFSVPISLNGFARGYAALTAAKAR
ncbi:invasion protein IalB [Rhodoligotrophos appendicifer]|uniref:invasion associated locus B family protein n=1 Tax=Rhodoligotrophos appendicifer TaxID=987056 RepID=UPI0011847E1E|nr:invasion associated locus B family protein [Rhodoligotrophos appendicifer]